VKVGVGVGKLKTSGCVGFGNGLNAASGSLMMSTVALITPTEAMKKITVMMSKMLLPPPG
jgi:hypothetical protein